MIRNGLLRWVLAGALAISIPTAAAAQEEATPEGTEWHLTAYLVDGESTAVSWAIDATLMLDAGTASGSNGCNTFSGNYTMDGEALTFGEAFTVTQMACTGDPGEVEQGYMTNLPSTASWVITDGALELSDADGAVILAYEQAVSALTPADIAALAAAFEAQQKDIDRLKRRVDNVRVTTLRSRIKALEDQVKALRDQVRSSRNSASGSSGASFTAAERILLEAVPGNIAGTCTPRRSQNPTGTLAAVQCKPNASQVRDMAYYLMRGNAAETVFQQRMDDNGVKKGGPQCWNGQPAVQIGTGNLGMEGCYVNDDGRANFRIATAAAGCNQVKVDGKWIKKPAVYVAVLGHDDDLAKLTRWVKPKRIGRDRITQPIKRPNAPGSGYCAS